MSTSFQCPHCPRNFSTRNAYFQHVNRCINTVYLSTEESSEDISNIVSSVNKMSLDNKDFSRINEFQIIREENSQVFYQYESDQDYAGDISFGEISHSSNIPEEYENFDEILSASLQSNEKPEVENIKEFPNEAYADLMALVIENNLNNKAGNAIIKFFNKHSDLSQLLPFPKNIEIGRKFMDKMNISQLSYSKYCVLTHNSQDYFVHYRPIKNCIKNLLSNPDILKNLMFRYENLKIEDEKSYGEQNSGNWWKRAERSISNHANILSIIFYSDATTTDILGKSSLHSIYVSSVLSRSKKIDPAKNKEDAKQLLEYLPILSTKNEKKKKSSEFKELARETFHNSIKFLLDPLFQSDSVDFNIDNKDIWFFPRISIIICDWLEACTFSLTYKSTNLNYPCHFCLVQREDLIDIRKEVILRNHVNMKEYFDNNTSNLAATVPDRMHHLDLGLFKYQIEFTMELLKKKKSLNKVNERIADIPRHSQLKVFKKGIQLSRLTASEYRDMMKIMVFVVDDLQIEDLSEVYVNNYFWSILNLNIYAATVPDRMHHLDLGLFKYQIEFTMELLKKKKSLNKVNERIADIPRHSQLKVFKKGIQLSRLTASEYRDMMKIMVFVVDDLQIEDLSEVYISNFHLKFLKLHSWIYHIVDTIREYGAINGYTTETYESLHKTYVKIPYRLSNKKEVEKQIMENIYSSVTLKNGAILRTKNDFYHRPWFSNIAVNMNKEELSEYLSDKGICYAQTLLITEIRLPNKSPMHLALVQWYDFIEETPFVYDCPLLKLVEMYNFIEIETIEDTIHVVPRFDKNNEYFVS
ncbi:hypothetical protein Glove_41g32 [Diversispora epigaea]|uniref:C2H2-type domain-containing protein n=1 Tax=Diversispora epigaea TaxID=1348612 RepID=A0A397JPC5_9GLOM|nr:hypothetical protein Glove_41g32 [Diversispora epigaea]